MLFVSERSDIECGCIYVLLDLVRGGQIPLGLVLRQLPCRVLLGWRYIDRVHIV